MIAWVFRKVFQCDVNKADRSGHAAVFKDDGNQYKVMHTCTAFFIRSFTLLRAAMINPQSLGKSIPLAKGLSINHVNQNFGGWSKMVR